MQDDYFFAPRPKLSLNLRIIQWCALLSAVVFSLPFVAWYVIVATGPHPFFFGSIGPRTLFAKILAIGWSILGQILMLIPCWRCWLLRKWACGLGLAIFWVVAAVVILSELNNPVWTLSLIFLVPITHIVREEWRNLNSGF